MKNNIFKTSLLATLAVIAMTLTACGSLWDFNIYAHATTVEKGYVGSYHFVTASGNCVYGRSDDITTHETISGRIVEWKWSSTPDSAAPEIETISSGLVAFLPTQPGIYVLLARYECGPESDTDSKTAQVEITVVSDEPPVKTVALLSRDESEAYLDLHKNIQIDLNAENASEESYLVQDLDQRL